MRIAVDARPLAHGPDGISRYLSSLLEILVDDEHQWFLYSDRAFNYSSLDSVSVRTGRVRNKLLSTIFAQFVFPVWSRLDDIDLFWGPRHHLPLMGGASRQMLTVHDMVWRKAPDTMKRFGRLSEKLLMPPALSSAHAILTPSESTARDVIEYCPSAKPRVHVTRLGCSLTAVSAARRSSADEKTILMVGTLEPRKNIEAGLDAYLLLRKKISHTIRLVIAGGKGWKTESLRKRLQDERQQGVEYLGPVSDEMLSQLYEEADIVLVPSLYEGFGLAAVEALAFGKPVVAADVSSLPEVVGKAGLLVDPYSVADMCDALHRLISDEHLYHELSGHAQQIGRQQTWADCAEKTRQVINQLAPP